MTHQREATTLTLFGFLFGVVHFSSYIISIIALKIITGKGLNYFISLIRCRNYKSLESLGFSLVEVIWTLQILVTANKIIIFFVKNQSLDIDIDVHNPSA